MSIMYMMPFIYLYGRQQWQGRLPVPPVGPGAGQQPPRRGDPHSDSTRDSDAQAPESAAAESDWHWHWQAQSASVPDCQSLPGGHGHGGRGQPECGSDWQPGPGA